SVLLMLDNSHHRPKLHSFPTRRSSDLLRESPFKVNPDPRYLFLTPGIQEALASLAYGIRGRRGIILLTGEVGTGKTTLIQMVLRSEEHTSELQSRSDLVCRLLLEKKK